MSDHPSAESQPDRTAPPPEILVQSALDQFTEDCRVYNDAVGSYNSHLDNHRELRELTDLPFRDPITAHPDFEDARNGNRAAIDSLLTHLLDGVHLDSQLRRHPRTFPIHDEAVEHLQIARNEVVTSLEAAHRHLQEASDG